MADESPQPPQLHMTATGSGSANMPVLGSGNQVNNFGTAGNDDIVMLIKHDLDEIRVEPEKPYRFDVEITNHGRLARKLRLWVSGVSTFARLDLENVELQPDEIQPASVMLQCTATEPAAGKRLLLRVRAEAADPEGLGPLAWKSEPKTIVIQARPGLTMSFTPPKESVSIPGRYRAGITLKNDGNVTLTGSVRTPDQEQVVNRPPHDRVARFAGSDQASLAATFNLLPAHKCDLSLDVELPAQGWRSRRWQIPVVATIDQRGVRPVRRQFEVVQQGLFADLPFFVAKARASARDRLARFVTWSSGTSTARRGVHLVAYVSLCALWLMSVVLIGSSSGERGVADTTATTSAPVPATPELPYTVMPCTPGTFAILLATMQPNDTEFRLDTLFKTERSRLNSSKVVEASKVPNVAPELLTDVRISRFADTCPAVWKDFTAPDPGKRFIWLGPVPVENPSDAQNVCIAIGKPRDHDCVPRPTT